MIFVETRSFSRRRTEQLTDEQFRLLQLSLLSNPQAGDVIRGTGGLRKLRWATTGRGNVEASGSFTTVLLNEI
jgi:hypothetical protein